MPTVDETGRWDAPAVSSADILPPRLAALQALADCARAEYQRLARETAEAARVAKAAIGTASAGRLFDVAKAKGAVSRAAEIEWRRADRAFQMKARERRVESSMRARHPDWFKRPDWLGHEA